MKVLLTTLGSSGDVNPLLGIAAELLRRGHQVGFATSLYFKAQVERQGCVFHEVYPNLDPSNEALQKIATDPVRGPEHLHRHHIFPALEKSYAIFANLLDAYDIVLSATLAYYAQLACRAKQKPWLSVVLSPMLFFSAYDPPVLAPLPWLNKFYYSPAVTKKIFRMLFRMSASWMKPLKQLQQKIGINDMGDPMLHAGQDANGTLAVFSRHFAAPQPDWPANTMLTGFSFFDEGVQHNHVPGLEDFLAANPMPVLFTLGTTAVMNPGKLYALFFAAQQQNKFACIVLTGKENYASYRQYASDKVFVAPYLPYSAVMPHCSIVVHQGGVGTTAQVLRSGRPGIVIPNCNDQYDNAARAERLGTSATLTYKKIRAENLAALIARVQASTTMAQKAKEIAAVIGKENGPQAAADFIEATWKNVGQQAYAGVLHR